MLHLIEFGDMEFRAKRLGLTLGQLAREVGLHETTVYAAARGRDMRSSNRIRLTQRLMQREREELRRLAALHPDELRALAGAGPEAGP